MAELTEERVSKEAIDLGFKFRRDASDRYSLIDEGTAQVAFEGSSLDEIQSILVEVRGFDLTCEEYGLGEIIVPVSRITINNEALLPIELYVVLLAGHFQRAFIPRAGNLPQQGFSLIRYKAWVEEAIDIFARPGFFSTIEARQALDIEDFAPFLTGGFRLLAKRSGGGDSESAQGITVVRLDASRALIGFGSVGTVIGIVNTYGADAFTYFPDRAWPIYRPDVQRALVARRFEQVKAKPISRTHPVWALLPPWALETYKLLVPQAPA
jgi:hypothetical protein